MQANARWEYPKGVNDGDMYDFVMKQDLTLDLISNSPSDTKQMFREGKTIKGTPARVQLQDPKTGKMATIEGILVKEADGIYVVAKEFVKAPIATTKDLAGGVLKGAEETIGETVDTVKKFDTERTLGFTKKQLLVMAITTLIIIKISN